MTSIIGRRHHFESELWTVKAVAGQLIELQDESDCIWLMTLSQYAKTFNVPDASVPGGPFIGVRSRRRPSLRGIGNGSLVVRKGAL